MITTKVIKARRMLRQAEAERHERVPALKLEIQVLTKKCEDAAEAYGSALEEAGLCRWCELPKERCSGHVLLAAAV